MLEIIQLCLNATKAIVYQIQLVKDNQQQCQQLHQQVMQILSLLQALSKLSNVQDEIINSLNGLKQTLQDCLDFITHFSESHTKSKKFWHFGNANNHKEVFDTLQNQLTINMAILQQAVGIGHKQDINKLSSELNQLHLEMNAYREVKDAEDASRFRSLQRRHSIQKLLLGNLQNKLEDLQQRKRFSNYRGALWIKI